MSRCAEGLLKIPKEIHVSVINDVKESEDEKAFITGGGGGGGGGQFWCLDKAMLAVSLYPSVPIPPATRAARAAKCGS